MAAFSGGMRKSFWPIGLESGSRRAPAFRVPERAMAVFTPARVNTGDLKRHLRCQHLDAQRLGEPAYGEFGSDVGRLGGDRDQPEQAGDIHQMAVTGGDEVGQEGHGAIHDPPKIGVHHTLNVRELHAENVTQVSYSGIVDDKVGGAEARDYFLGVGQHCGAVGDVEMIGQHGGTSDRAC